MKKTVILLSLVFLSSFSSVLAEVEPEAESKLRELLEKYDVSILNSTSSDARIKFWISDSQYEKAFLKLSPEYQVSFIASIAEQTKSCDDYLKDIDILPPDLQKDASEKYKECVNDEAENGFLNEKFTEIIHKLSEQNDRQLKQNESLMAQNEKLLGEIETLGEKSNQTTIATALISIGATAVVTVGVTKRYSKN